MELTREQRDWLCLALTPGVGTARFIRLLARLGTPGRVLSATQAELADVVGENLAARIRQNAQAADLDLQEDRMNEYDVVLLTMDDPLYPSQLAEIYDPPLLLYLRGELKDEDQYAVAFNELEAGNSTAAQNLADSPQYSKGPGKSKPHTSSVNERRPDRILAGKRLGTAENNAVHHNQRNKYPKGLV